MTKESWEERIAKFAKSLDGRWIYLLKDDNDDEDNWHFLDEHLSSERHRLLEEVKEIVTTMNKEQLDKNDLDNYEACYAIAGFNDALAKITTALTTLEKSMRYGTFSCWSWGHKFIGYEQHENYDKGYKTRELTPYISPVCVRCGAPKDLKD